MERLYSGKGSGNQAVFKEAISELQLPLRKRDGGVVDQLAEIMGDLIPDSPDRAATFRLREQRIAGRNRADAPQGRPSPGATLFAARSALSLP